MNRNGKHRPFPMSSVDHAMHQALAVCSLLETET